MALSKINSRAIEDLTVSADDLANGTVTVAKLSSTLDLSSNTITLPNTSVTSAKLSYPLTTFSSTGIDDNATSTAITIDSSENVGIGESAPLGKLHIKTGDSGQGTAQGEADELVIEGSGNAGINILSGDSNLSMISFGDSADANVGFIHYDHSNNAMTFRANAADRLIIHSDGVAAFNNGIALGVGTANTASNVLDDYEEGTWTPTTNIGYSAINNAYYVKTGRMVLVHMDVVTNAGPGDGSQATSVSGLPFAGKSGDQISGSNIIKGLNQDVYAEVGGTAFAQRDRADDIHITRGEYGSKTHRCTIIYYTDS